MLQSKQNTFLKKRSIFVIPLTSSISSQMVWTSLTEMLGGSSLRFHWTRNAPSMFFVMQLSEHKNWRE